MTVAQFDNGTVWNRSTFKTLLLSASQTPGNDRIIGFSGNDILVGGQGNDILDGRLGSDTYVFSRGDGQDIISDEISYSNHTDRLQHFIVL